VPSIPPATDLAHARHSATPLLDARALGVWLLSSLLGILLCLQELPGTLASGQFFPADHDSYYHATRVETALRDGGGVTQFDPRLHAPDGSWVPWPWGYDTLLLGIAHAGIALGITSDAMTVLAFVAPLWLLLNQALLLGIARQLGIGVALQTLLLSFNALLLITRGLHRIGMLDHHFVEYSVVLATLWAGLRWAQAPDRRREGMLLGAVLGLAPALHNSLFVLQLPILLGLGIAWLAQRPPGWPATAAFAATLIGLTALGLLPSEPFHAGEFAFYLHSGFQLYVAAATAALAMAMSLLRRGARPALLLAAGAGLLALPLLAQLSGGGQFLTADFFQLASMGETRSPLAMLADGDQGVVLELYSGLILLLPVSLLLLFWACTERRDAASGLLFVFTLFGSALLLFQYRLAYFGSFALLLPLCVAAQQLVQRTTAAQGRALLAGLAGLTLLALWPSYRDPGPRTITLSGDSSLSTGLLHFANLREACTTAPGTVLADNNDGHYITYFSRCAVIANNFIISPTDEAKLAEVASLMRSEPVAVLAARPDVRYLLVRRADPHIYRGQQGCGAACPENAGLRAALLFTDTFPDGLTLISETRAPADGVPVPVIRLFARATP
jgi:hypothetical protein